MPPRFPKSSEISAALAALGVYAQVPSERELAEPAIDKSNHATSTTRTIALLCGWFDSHPARAFDFDEALSDLGHRGRFTKDRAIPRSCGCA